MMFCGGTTDNCGNATVHTSANNLQVNSLYIDLLLCPPSQLAGKPQMRRVVFVTALYCIRLACWVHLAPRYGSDGAQHAIFPKLEENG